MSLTLSTAARNAACNAIVDLIDVGGAGSAVVRASSTVLATIALNDPAFGAASSGASDLDAPVSDASADDSGTADNCQILSGGATLIFSCTAGESGAQTLTLETVARDAACNAVVDLIDAGAGDGYLEVRASTTVLATFTLAATAFGAASTGAAVLAGLPLTETAIADGTADNFIFYDSDDNVIFSGTVGESAADLILDNTDIATDQDVTITDFTYTHPASGTGGLILENTDINATQEVEITSGSLTIPAS